MKECRVPDWKSSNLGGSTGPGRDDISQLNVSQSSVDMRLV